MSIYLNTNQFPINLYNNFDEIIFYDFNQMLEYFKQNSKTEEFSFTLNKVFQQNDDNTHLFRSLLSYFPFNFFSTEISNLSNFENEIKEHSKIINPEILSDLVSLKINLKEINIYLDELDNSPYCNISISSLVSQIFIIYYKYSFVQISKSLLLNNEKASFDDLINTYKIIKEDLVITNHKTKINKVIVNNLALEQIQSFFTIKGYDVKRIMTEFDVLSNKSSLAKWIYISLEQNIRFDGNLSATKKNKLMRPLFYELVCSVCYPEYYEHDINSTEVTNKFRDFKNSYKNYF